MTLIDARIDRLHRLAWQPGASMHDAWWPRLGLGDWRFVYRGTPSCRPAVDAAIVARRGFPTRPLPAALPARSAALLELAPQWTRYITALGLVMLDCPEHLLLGENRKALAHVLDERDCEQLLAILGQWSTEHAPEPATRLADAALDAGARWWARDTGADMTCLLLTTLLAPVEPVGDMPRSLAADWMIRIARYL